MIFSKIRRELTRLCLQTVCGLPYLFPDGFCRSVKKSWNRLQYEEGRLVTKDVVFQKEHGCARIIDLRHTSGFGEAVHPDVIRVPGGFGAGRWEYLMVVTPFPCGIVYFENPEFLVSRDGEKWIMPEGQPSPLVAAPSDWIGYNSDPSLLYDDGRLYLFYREVRAEDNRHDRIRLFALTTLDGERWGEPRAVFDMTVPKEQGALLLSPTFLDVGGLRYMWHVETEDGSLAIKRSELINFSSIENTRDVEVYGMSADDTPWHIDVACDKERLIMALCVRSKSNGRRHSIVFAESGDAGLTWRVCGERIEPEESLDEKSLYRAALAPNTSGGWKLYYSYQDFQGHWFPVVRDIFL